MIKEIVDAEGRRDMRGMYCSMRGYDEALQMTPGRWISEGFGNCELYGDPNAVDDAVKTYQAQTFADVWRDSTVGATTVRVMRDFLCRNDVVDIMDAMSWDQQGVVYAALMYGIAYGKGDLPKLDW